MQLITYMRDIRPILTDAEHEEVLRYIREYHPSKELQVLHNKYNSYLEYFNARNCSYAPFTALRTDFAREWECRT